MPPRLKAATSCGRGKGKERKVAIGPSSLKTQNRGDKEKAEFIRVDEGRKKNKAWSAISKRRGRYYYQESTLGKKKRRPYSGRRAKKRGQGGKEGM